MISAAIVLLAALVSAASATTCCPAYAITTNTVSSISGGYAAYYSIEAPEPLPTGYTLDITVSGGTVTNVLTVAGTTVTISGHTITITIGSSGHANQYDNINIAILYATTGPVPTITSACFVGVTGPNCPVCLAATVVPASEGPTAGGCERYVSVVAPQSLPSGWTIFATSSAGTITSTIGGQSSVNTATTATVTWDSTNHVNSGGSISLGFVFATTSTCPTITGACFVGL